MHTLPEGYRSHEEYNSYLESNGCKLNDSGGKITVSDDSKLRQSSTVAQVVEGEFRKGRDDIELHQISGSYVEFAERLVLDQFQQLPPEQIRREHRRDGFEAQNADKIFESTYISQTGSGEA